MTLPLHKEHLFLIAGPCVIETRELTLAIAEGLEKMASHLNIPFIFKASFDKANRSSVSSYRGPGLTEGLRILEDVKQETGVQVISDIHCPEQAKPAAEVLDFIQIPAFLCRQTDLIRAAMETGKPVNIKKGQFLSPWECQNIITKAKAFGNSELTITERGTTFGYNNLVVDFRSIDIIHGMGIPVIFDATHSVQLPGGQGTASGGESAMAPCLAKAAVAAGADGIFIETHPNPSQALCDGPNAIPLDTLPDLLSTLIRIKKAIAQ